MVTFAPEVIATPVAVSNEGKFVRTESILLRESLSEILERFQIAKREFSKTKVFYESDSDTDFSDEEEKTIADSISQRLQSSPGRKIATKFGGRTISKAAAMLAFMRQTSN